MNHFEPVTQASKWGLVRPVPGIRLEIQRKVWQGRRVSIVTKTGDQGTTGLMYNRRVSKCHPRVESYGAVDELTSALGLARANAPADKMAARIKEIQQVLISVMGELATALEDTDRYARDGYPKLTEAQVQMLEEWITEAEASVGVLKGWAIPGDNMLAAALDLARTACRNAERRICALLEKGELPNPQILIFLNRLSDLLWLWARCAGQ